MRPFSEHPRFCRAAAGVLAMSIASALAACAGALGGSTEATAKTPAAIILVQGGAQTGQAGRDLPNQIVLRLVDATGQAVSGATVSLAVSEGGGAVTPASDTTDSHGEFHAKWTLGAGVVVQSLIASSPGVTPVAIGATGLLPTSVILVQGSNQSAKTGSVLLNSVIVRVVGNGNVPMVGVTVAFQVLSGGGGMAPPTVVTNSLGEASTKWTMGAVGAQSAAASSGSLAPVTITATATP
jgi:hypothetical protein